MKKAQVEKTPLEVRNEESNNQMKAELAMEDDEIFQTEEETEVGKMIREYADERRENESLYSFLERQTKNQIRQCLGNPMKE